MYIAKCKTQHNSLQHALCNTLFTDPVPHAHSYVEVQYMVLESSSDDFKAGWCKVGFKTLLRPQDSHGLGNTNTCLIVDDNIFCFEYASRRLIPTLILAISNIQRANMQNKHFTFQMRKCANVQKLQMCKCNVQCAFVATSNAQGVFFGNV